MASQFGVLDYCLFVGVLALSTLSGFYYILKERWRKGRTTADDVLMGGRDMGIFPVSMSLIASYMSAITVLGIPTEIYVFGTGYWLVAVAGFFTIPVTCHVFLPFFHKMKLSSAYEYLELRFNKWTRYMASAIFTIETLMYISVVLYAPALALNQVTGLSLWMSIISLGLVVAFYTSMGGLRAVLWTDTFQTCVVVCGLSAVIGIGTWRLGGVSTLWKEALVGGRLIFFNFDPSPFTRITVWGTVFGSFIGQLTIYGANQTMLQRYMSIKNVRNSQIALYITLPVTTLLVSLVCVAGLVIFATYRTCDPLLNEQIISRDQLLPYFVMDTLSHIYGISGMFVACIFAAALSSISSCLNALSITVLEDMIKPIVGLDKIHFSEVWIAKFIGIINGGLTIFLAFVISLIGTEVLQVMIIVLGAAGGPLLGLFILGMFFPCCNAKGAIFGTLISLLVTFWIAIGGILTQEHPQELPMTTSGCFTSANSTTITYLNADSAVFTYSPMTNQMISFSAIYQLSFLWYPTVSVLVSVTTGVIVSWITCWGHKILDAKLVIVPESWMPHYQKQFPREEIPERKRRMRRK